MHTLNIHACTQRPYPVKQIGKIRKAHCFELELQSKKRVLQEPKLQESQNIEQNNCIKLP